MATIIDLPCGVGLTSTRFDPIRSRKTARMEGRRTEEDVSPEFYWVASYSTPTKSLRHFGELDDFAMAIDSGAFFRAFDTTRPRPVKYINGALSGTKAAGGAFDGTASLQSITDSRTIVVSGLPAAWQLRVGDYIELRQSPEVVSLHRVAEDVASNASGVATIKIRFALPPGIFSAGATVNFEKPSFLAKTDPGSFNAMRRREDRSISFSAQEMVPGVSA